MNFICASLVSLIVGLKGSVEPAKILFVSPLPSFSHQSVYDPLILELASRGHEVISVTAFPVSNPPANLTQIDISFSRDEYKKGMTYYSTKKLKPIEFYETYQKIIPDIFERQLQVPELKKILEDEGAKFDLIFIALLGRQAYGFVHRFKGVPLISIASLTAGHSIVGAPTHPILYSEYIRIRIYNLTFFERVEIFLDHIYYLWIEWRYNEIQTNLARKYFGEDMPPLNELMSRTDLLFVSSDPVLCGVRPDVPAVVHIDGIHLKEKKQLPKDLKVLLDASTQGVIYVSFGSNIQSRSLGHTILETLKKAFDSLPYVVLWKFEDDSLLGKPDNVFIRKWLPQQDLLGHKNIKAFIFQGGQQSLEEAVRDEVPLVCIPFAIDQHANAEKIVHNGIGVMVDIEHITAEILVDAVMEVTQIGSYKENMRKISTFVKDKPFTPMENAIWWTEYVLRHKGAQHFRSPTLDISYAEFFMLDVIAALLCAALLVLGLFCGVFYLIKNIVSRSGSGNSHHKKNN